MTLKTAMHSTTVDEAESSPRKTRMLTKVKVFKHHIKKKDRLIKILNQKVRRKSRKIASMRAIMTELKRKNLISEDVAEVLKDVTGANRDLLERYLLSVKSKPPPKAYEPHIRAFALNLNFLSPKAYKYVRETFNNCLPHTRSI